MDEIVKRFNSIYEANGYKQACETIKNSYNSYEELLHDLLEVDIPLYQQAEFMDFYINNIDIYGIVALLADDRIHEDIKDHAYGSLMREFGKKNIHHLYSIITSKYIKNKVKRTGLYNYNDFLHRRSLDSVEDLTALPIDEFVNSNDDLIWLHSEYVGPALLIDHIKEYLRLKETQYEEFANPKYITYISKKPLFEGDRV